MKNEKSTLYELQRIAQRAKLRVGNDESLDSNLIHIREELLKDGYDYDIFDIMSGLEESYSVFYSESDFWIQLFSGKGSKNSAVSVRIIAQKPQQETRVVCLRINPSISRQEFRLAA